jgi:hypothetical protein
MLCYANDQQEKLRKARMWVVLVSEFKLQMRLKRISRKGWAIM